MPSSSSSLINTIIPSTRLLLTSIIGSGSFARVYLAVDADHGSGKQQHQQQYAVKVLDKRGLTRDQVNSQHREVSIMAKLAHPHVIRLERVVETSRYLYLIMEWCEMDLYDAITQTAGFPPAIVKQVFDQLAAALEHCHQNGIYHRDIKPENALISPEYTVKLADFGLATNDSWSTEMGCGSVRYMAPECIDTPDTRARGYAPAGTDVWSLGVILINLLFGKNPWHEATPNDAIYAAYIGSNPNVLCDQFHITPEFDQLLRCLFQPDPLKRCSVAQARSLVKALPYFTL
ncbi:kinase-like domain-containing protein, partial [Phlyctochytrium arcticum]